MSSDTNLWCSFCATCLQEISKWAWHVTVQVCRVVLTSCQYGTRPVTQCDEEVGCVETTIAKEWRPGLINTGSNYMVEHPNRVAVLSAAGGGGGLPTQGATNLCCEDRTGPICSCCVQTFWRGNLLINFSAKFSCQGAEHGMCATGPWFIFSQYCHSLQEPRKLKSITERSHLSSVRPNI